MPARTLDTTTAAALEKSIIPLAIIIKLYIVGDPLYCWSGIGDYAPSGTGDAELDGTTFAGIGTLIEIGTISDGVGGSDVLEIGLPGVNITDPMLRQVIYNHNRWQFKRALVWLMLLDETTGAVAGKPFRVKTGRIDQMIYTETDNSGTIRCRIEGQQSYGNQPLNTRYSEQKLINPNDNSQTWVQSLALMTAALGQANAVPITTGGGGRNFDKDIRVNLV